MTLLPVIALREHRDSETTRMQRLLLRELPATLHRPRRGSSAQVSLFYATAWKVSLRPSASQTLSTVDQVGLPWSERAL